MSIVEVIRAVLVVYAGWWTSYVLALPLLATLRRRNHAPTVAPDSELPTVAIIIPAHNMRLVIERCVEAMRASDYPGHLMEVFVVADHCTDDTASLAENAGATVLTRDEGPPGKTYTLAWTFDKLKDVGRSPGLYVITDATARVEDGFLRALANVYMQGEDIVVSHSLVDSENQKWFARCLGLTLVHRNFQNWSRQELRLSALIEGRGMAYSSKYINQYGWSLAVADMSKGGNHPTEDWRHGVQAVEQGLRVAFADDARVITPLRDNLADATRQGARWERGRMANAATHATRLLSRGLRERNATKILAALDAIQPPVAILGIVCIVLAALTGFTAGSFTQIATGFVPVVLFFVYGLAVVSRGRRDGISPVTVLWAPVYLAWRLTSFILAWSFFDSSPLGARGKSKKQST